MDFSLSDDQKQIQDSVRQYLADHYGFAQRRAIVESASGWSPDLWRGLADLGLLGLAVPEEDGGLQRGVTDLALVASELGDALVVEPFLSSAVVATRIVAMLGSPAQRARWLPAMAEGSLVAVLAADFGPSAGLAPPLQATETGTGWRLEGRMPLVYHAPVAGMLLLPVSTHGASEPNAVFAVPADRAGLSLQPAVTVDSQRAADLHVRDLEVTAEDRVGGEAGAALAAVSDEATVVLCGEALGALQRTLALTVEYTRGRVQFGGPIARFQALQHRMVEMLMHIEQARSLLWLAAARCDAGAASERRAAVSAAKVLVSEAARYVGQQAVQLHGGMGVSDDMPISHYFKRLTAVQWRFGSADQHLDRYAAGQSAPGSGWHDLGL